MDKEGGLNVDYGEWVGKGRVIGEIETTVAEQ